MDTRSWWHGFWSAGFAFALAGCGQGETPKPPNAAAPSVPAKSAAPAVSEPAPKDAPAEQPAAKPATPASLEETRRVIDFRKFPIQDGAKVREKKSVTHLSCQLPKQDAAEAAKFYRAKLAEAGWKVEDDPSLGHGQVIEDNRYFLFTATKLGFFLDGGVIEDRAKDELSVRFTNYGNIDSRTLPRMAGAELKHPAFWGTSYRTDATPDAVLEFTRKELAKGGWREVEMPARFKRANAPGKRQYLRFIQRGIQTGVTIDVQAGKTECRYQMSVLSVELPIMPEATGEVEFLDGEQSLLHLFYAAPVGPEKVLEFYRNALPDMGWTLRAGTDQIENGKANVMLDAPEKESLRLELLADEQGALVLITAGPALGKPAAPKPKPKQKPG
jgi:hypothetical protein